MLADASKHIAQVGFWVEAVQARCSYQSIEDGRAPPSGVGTGKQIVATADGDRAQRSLRDHVVYFDAAIIEIARKCIPERECIVDRGGGLGLGCQLRACLFQPSSHVVEQRSGPCGSNGAAFLRRSALDLLLDPVEGGDALNGFGGDGRVVRLQQVEELASDVRHARCLLNRSALIKLIKTCEGVGLQDACELGQMALRVFDDMRRWLEQARTQLAPKSETAAAIHYALALWDALARYLDDGRIELDNMIAERALRPVAMGCS